MAVDGLLAVFWMGKNGYHVLLVNRSDTTYPEVTMTRFGFASLGVCGDEGLQRNSGGKPSLGPLRPRSVLEIEELDEWELDFENIYTIALRDDTGEECRFGFVLPKGAEGYFERKEHIPELGRHGMILD